MDFEAFFEGAVGYKLHRYQRIVAFDTPPIVRAPTGSGKTGAVIVGWLWRRGTAPGH